MRSCSRAIRRRTPVAGLLAATVLAASCGATGDTASSSTTTTERRATTASTTSTTSTTLATIPEPTNPSTPTDPASLGPCPPASEPLDVNLPSEWWPASLPDATVVLEAYTTRSWDRSVDPQTGARTPVGWRTQLYRTDVDGRMVASTSVHAMPDMPPADPGQAGAPGATQLRGRQAFLGTQTSPGGVTMGTYASWVEGSTGYRIDFSGDEAELRAFVEGTSFTPDSVSSPAGGYQVVASGPGLVSSRTTTIGLGVPAQHDALPVQVVVEQPSEGQTGPATHGSVPLGSDQRIISIAGRTAIVGQPSESTTTISTTNADGVPVWATGPFTVEQLGAIIASLEPVTPDDQRLAGVRIGPPAGAVFVWCREDR